jgi:hypothetical protein
MSPDELGIVVKLAAIGLRELERRDGVHDPALREVVYRLSLEARAARFGEASMIASVTHIDDAPSKRALGISSVPAWRRCEECDRSTDRLRRGVV